MQKKDYLKKVNNTSVVQQIIDALTDAMISRQLRPGDKIPTESELAEQMGVGRNSVREAIKILVYLGVLEIRRAEGTFVRSGFSETMINPLIYGIILDEGDSCQHLMELRELMEVGVIQLSLKKRKDQDIERLRSCLETMAEEIEKGPENMERIFEADNEFHNAISEMGDNPLVDKINRVVRILTHSMRYNSSKYMIFSGRGQELFEAHRRIYDMIANEETKNMNEAVRNTYFPEYAMDEKN